MNLDSLFLESLLASVLCFAVLLLIAWRFRLRAFRVCESVMSRLAINPARAVLVAGLLGFVVSMTIGVFRYIPEPHIHDEFSYLLAADTFSRGRLTNPSPPLWQHFESMHILVVPTYASKYPPAQGMVLALGQMVGDPAVGLWISAGLASAACCWMLFAWIPGRWAATVGLLCALHPLILKWGQMFWGGHMAFIGGALVLGAARRLHDRPGVANALMLAVGMGILANSRPFEGLVFSLIALSLVVSGYREQSKRQGRPGGLVGKLSRQWLRQVALPALAVLTAFGSWMAYYNVRVTGKPLQMPYMLHEKQYWIAPVLMFLPTRREEPPMLRHGSMRAVALHWAVPTSQEQRTPLGFVVGSLNKWGILAGSALQLYDLSAYGFDGPPSPARRPFLGLRWLLILPLFLGLPAAIRGDRWARWTARAFAAFSLALLMDTWMHPHYGAPGGSLLVLLLAYSLMRLRACCWQSRRTGLGLSRLIVLLFVLSSVRAVAEFGEGYFADLPPRREVFIGDLQQRPGNHLVLVDYSPAYPGGNEWVYNGANLKSQRIVWARYLTSEENRRLVKSFGGRSVWHLYFEQGRPLMKPYRGDAQSAVRTRGETADK